MKCYSANGMSLAATAGSRSWHSMNRRNFAHAYSRTGIYHITIHVADGMGQPLGAVVGDDADSAAVALTPVGEAVRNELLTAITFHYPMITVDAFVVMPEHLHFILIVRDNIITKNGSSAHLGQVIAGFKSGCNRAFWAVTGQTASAAPAAKPLDTVAATTGAVTAAHSAVAGYAGGRPQNSSGGKPRYSTGRPPLFSPGFCDVMPVDAAQLATQRRYIKDNPRSRLLRSKNRAWLSAQRGTIGTALTLSALRGYLQRECHPSQATAEALTVIEGRLLVADGGQTAASTAPVHARQVAKN